MTTLREAAQQALEIFDLGILREEQHRRVEALRAALAEPVQEPVQEPVAWIQPDHLQKARVAPFFCRVEPTPRCADFVPLYTAPPQPAEPVQPVAWRVRGYAQFKTGKPGPWRYFDGAGEPAVNTPDCCDFERLYTAPPQRKPLTREQAMKIVEVNPDAMTAVRMTEAAHGITGDKA